MMRIRVVAMSFSFVLALAAPSEERPLHKPISVHYRGQELVDVLRDVGRLARVRVAYDRKKLGNAGLVTLKATKQEVGRVLTRILRPRGLRFEEVEAGRLTVVRRDPLDEFEAKREESFEFAEKPKVTRAGDRVKIGFTTKGWCDVTVAIEDATGKIVRHLASGVLGANAPEPFHWNSKKQTLVWDGKNDKGEYADHKDSLLVRVSLGLKARFERTLYWSPRKIGPGEQVMCAAKEGVFVYRDDILGPGHMPKLCLYDHDGRYVRTVYPFPRNQLGNVRGLQERVFPPGSEKFPVKWGLGQSSLLTLWNPTYGRQWPTGREFVAMRSQTIMAAAANGRLYLFGKRMNRLHANGSTGGLSLTGPACRFPVPKGQVHSQGMDGDDLEWVPRSAAVSPDGKWIYLTGYFFVNRWGHVAQTEGAIHGVFRMEAAGDKGPELFLGRHNKTADSYSLKKADLNKSGPGDDNDHFYVPTSIACDAQGRLYVSDYMNDRLQVFTAAGKYLKTIPVKKPARVVVHHETGELYVFSWYSYALRLDPKWGRVFNPSMPATLTHLGPMEKPEVLGSYRLPKYMDSGGYLACAEIDFHVKPFRLWLTRAASRGDVIKAPWNYKNIRIYELRNGKLGLVRDFHDDVRKSVVQARPPLYGRWRVYCNPRNGHVYAAEQVQPTPLAGVSSFDELVEIDPDTGRIRMVKLPFDTDDLMFDVDGHAYLRTMAAVARYDSATWREVPFDYGEELQEVYHYVGRRTASLASGLVHAGGQWGANMTIGMGVSPKGNLAVGYILPGYKAAHALQKFSEKGMLRTGKPGTVFSAGSKPYKPKIYPGRAPYAVIHVFDKHGKMLHEDAVPGIGMTMGIKIDNKDALYLLANARRNCGGKPYPNQLSGTLFKVRAGHSKILSDNSSPKGGGRQGIPLPLVPRAQPSRPADMLECVNFGGRAWVEGAEWFYGGGGANARPVGCNCGYTGTFAMDLFGRSFAPEPHRYDVVVVDSAGNTVLRIGKYGNMDDGVPLVAQAAPRAGDVPPNPRSIGGDEVGLTVAWHVATHTDHRLFISDIGNFRIVGVKLGYHGEERVALKDVKDERKREDE